MIDTEQQLQQTSVTGNVATVLLGVFHLVCLAVIVNIAAFPYTTPIFGLSYSIVVLANAFVAIGVTAPLFGARPSPRWRTMWLLWLFLPYLIVRYVQGDLLAIVRQNPLADPGRFTVIARPLDALLAILCVFALAWTVDGLKWKRLAFLGWPIWLVVGCLTVACSRNSALLSIPSFLLIMIGCYVAYSALGYRWVWLSVAASICLAAFPCGQWAHDTFVSAASRWHSVGDLLGLYNLLRWAGEVQGIGPNAVSAWVLLIFVFALAAITSMRSIGKSLPFRLLGIGLCVSTLVIFVDLVLNGRRNAYVGLFLILPVWLLLRKRYTLRKILLVAGVAAAAVIFLDWVNIIPIRQILAVDGSADDRVTLLKSSLWMFRQHPLFGVGIGRWSSYFIDWAHQNHYANTTWSYPHNDFFWVLSEGGIIGLLLGIGAGLQVLSVFRKAGGKNTPLSIMHLLHANQVQMIVLALAMATVEGVFASPQWMFTTAAIASAVLAVAWTNPSTDNRQVNVPKASQRMFAICGLLLVIVVASIFVSSQLPRMVWREARSGGGNIFYGGGVYNGTFYTGQIWYGPQHWSSVKTNGTALVQSIDDCSPLAKSAVPIGKYIFCTTCAPKGGLVRIFNWNPATMLDLGIPATSVTSDGIDLYTNDAYVMNRIHKYTVNPHNGSVEEAWSVAVGAPKNEFHALSYYANHIYAVDQCSASEGDLGIYEIDTQDGLSRMIAQMPYSGAYQVARYGRSLFVVGNGDRLYMFNLNGKTWRLCSSYSLGLGDMYGIGLTGDGTNPTNMWITSFNHAVSYWTTPKQGRLTQLVGRTRSLLSGR